MRNILDFLAGIFSGLRFRLLVLVAVACAPLVALTLHTAWEERRRQVATWGERSQRMVQLAAHEEEKIVGQTKQLLLAMAESSAVRQGARRGCKRLVDA